MISSTPNFIPFSTVKESARAEGLKSSREPVGRHGVSAPEDDLVDGNSGCGYVIDGKELDAFEAPLRCEVEDRNPSKVRVHFVSDAVLSMFHWQDK